jgi:hypothetical protein
VHGVGRALADRLGDVLLLDVRVEGVVHHPQVRVIHFATETGRVGGRVEEIALEAVQIFEHQRHAGLLGVIGQIAEEFLAALPLIRRRPFAGEFADR